MSALNSVSEIVECQRQVGHFFFDERHGRLEIVSFGPGHSHRFALDRGLDFHFAVFDHALEFFGILCFDAVLHTEHHLDFVAPHLLRLALVDEAHVHLSFGEFAAKDVLDLAQLKISISNQGDLLVFEFDGRCRAFEVKAGSNFFGGVVHCVFNFNQIGFANRVK